MTAQQIKHVSHQVVAHWNHDLMPRLALAGSLLFITSLVVGVL